MSTEFNIFVNHPTGYRCHFKITEDGDITKRIDKLLVYLDETGYTPSLKTNDVLSGNGNGKHPEQETFDPWGDDSEPHYVPVETVSDDIGPKPGDKLTMVIERMVVVPKPDNKATLELYAPGHKFADLFCSNWDVDKLVKLTGMKEATFLTARDMKVNLEVGYVISDKKTQRGNYYKNVTTMKSV